LSIETIRRHLSELKLHVAASDIEEILAKQKKSVPIDWIEDLLCREIDHRRERATMKRIKDAEFPEVTTIENFDFQFNPDIDEARIRRLASLDFIKERRIILLLGKPGTGKTHLALAIGVRAAKAGQKVYCTSIKRLGLTLMKAKAKGNLDRLFAKILSASLWIFDDWGVVSMSREMAEEVFDLLDRRKHSSAMILTSNRDVSEWGQVFPDPVLASAAIDRLFDRAEIQLFNGQSYRLKGRITDIELDHKEVSRH
jgi:DNA replication protein DnaC